MPMTLHSETDQILCHLCSTFNKASYIMVDSSCIAYSSFWACFLAFPHSHQYYQLGFLYCCMSFHKVMAVCITSIVQNHHWEYLKLSQSIMIDLEVVCATLACGTVSCKTLAVYWYTILVWCHLWWHIFPGQGKWFC